MVEIEKVKSGVECCMMQEYGASCHRCPYKSDSECIKKLTDDVFTALKRLEFLEKPTPEEQPELPGIPKC